ncbi:site-specific integrase [Paraburkholderia humisilvae]|uniref:site-specific integrase n=1 Tax=Paraburkholderia humisilvae TaxID=627669 RepID=UPI0015837A8B|nr:site-specific integrase [Paraburkholderia humisilvae]
MDTDIEAVSGWLAAYKHSPNTLYSYRREALRVLVWATRELGKPLSSLTREDFLLYEHFLAAPSLDWINPLPSRSGSSHRLFVGSLSRYARQRVLFIMSSMLNHLVSTGYLAVNPLSTGGRRVRGTQRAKRLMRSFDHSLWQYVLDSIEAWPQTTLRERQRYERSRWTMRLLHDTPLSVSAAAHARAGDFVRRNNNWRLRLNRDAEVADDVPVSETLMSEFARYRAFHSLSSVPYANEATPTVMSIAGHAVRQLSPGAVYLIASEVFRRAAIMLEPIDPVGSSLLAHASSYWLRHRMVSHQTADARVSIRQVGEKGRHCHVGVPQPGRDAP